MRIILSSNPYRDRGLRTALEADRILRKAGAETVLCLPFVPKKGERLDLPRQAALHKLEEELPKADLLVCFGGDGTILHAALATPTGSTAYSMSAGGPIVEPNCRCIVVTPVCAHQLSSRAMVLDAGRRITVQMPKGSRKHLYLSVDGGKVIRVTANERVEITQSQYSTRLVQLAGRSFYQVTNQKLGGYVP